MKTIANFFDSLFILAATTIESSFLNLSLVFAPAVPAGFFGFNVGQAFYDITGSLYGAIAIGSAMAFAVESSGYLTMSNAIRNYELYQSGEASKEKFYFSMMLSFGYLAVGIISLIVIEYMGHGDLVITILGIFSFLIAAIVYIAQADNMLARHKSRKERVSSKDKREDAKEIKRMKLQFEHEQKMAAIKASQNTAQPKAQGVTSESRLDAIYPNATTAKNIILHLRDNPDATSNKTQMAKDLGVSRKTLHTYLNLIKQYGDGDVQ